MFSRKNFILINPVAAGCLPAFAGRNANNTVKPPNLLFIIIDQQRFDALSIAGISVLKTPDLDRIAKKGAWFRNA